MFALEVPVPEVSAQLDRDQAIWTEWANGRRRREIAAGRGISRQAVDQAIARYQASMPAPERAEYRARHLERYEELYRAHRATALERPRVAAIVRGILDSEARLLGLEPKELHVSGSIDHEHYTDPGPSMAELLEQWRAEGIITPARGPASTTVARLDQAAGP